MVTMKTHFRAIAYNGSLYPSLSKHGDIHLFRVKQLIKVLGIDVECAKQHFPQIFHKQVNKSAQKKRPRGRPPVRIIKLKGTPEAIAKSLFREPQPTRSHSS